MKELAPILEMNANMRTTIAQDKAIIDSKEWPGWSSIVLTSSMCGA